ncbi:hypothetical protein [Corynebacterium diphtheriae]|uniref:hypothetical protein n=1 Tax=Corynebacterium diphtheriae TaxID=1717 RepID=UPI000EB37E27|nr:hypothetical protein [Corynebacterium diphtheriae]RKW93784.1 hypothetical protein D9B51_10270 [Corynebacterium diphtheriae]
MTSRCLTFSYEGRQQGAHQTVWYPVVKKIAAMLGQKITKQTVGSAVTKVVPVLGGVGPDPR